MGLFREGYTESQVLAAYLFAIAWRDIWHGRQVYSRKKKLPLPVVWPRTPALLSDWKKRWDDCPHLRVRPDVSRSYRRSGDS